MMHWSGAATSSNAPLSQGDVRTGLAAYTSFDEEISSFDGAEMTSTTTTRAKTGKAAGSREAVIAEFWEFSAHRFHLNEAERLVQIKEGFPARLFQGVRVTFALHERSLEGLLNASISTLERRVRQQQPLDSVASERLDRIAAVSRLAETVFESRELAAQWMSKPNKALGDEAPIMLCETEIGARQVRRVLHALEWGGAA